MKRRSPLLGALQLHPKRRAQGFDAVYAQPFRFATDAVWAAGTEKMNPDPGAVLLWVGKD
jgi:hypothetical protein